MVFTLSFDRLYQGAVTLTIHCCYVQITLTIPTPDWTITSLSGLSLAFVPNCQTGNTKWLFWEQHIHPKLSIKVSFWIHFTSQSPIFNSCKPGLWILHVFSHITVQRTHTTLNSTDFWVVLQGCNCPFILACLRRICVPCMKIGVCTEQCVIFSL